MSYKNGFPDFIRNEYDICKFLGKGAFGCVYLVKDRYNGHHFAMKVLQKTGNVANEAHVMLKLNHPHITGLHEYFETCRKCYILMNYMRGGNLRRRLERHGGKLSENLSKIYFLQMCMAVQYLHDNDIIHRDLKPDNMLLASENNQTLLKVSDFGCSINCYNYMYSSVGTILYSAPEILNHYKYGKKVDIWSLGAVLFECLSGVFPFECEDDILEGNYDFSYYKWNYVSDCAKSLIKSIFKVHPSRRCNIMYVLKSDWLNDDDVWNTVKFLRQKFN